MEYKPVVTGEVLSADWTDAAAHPLPARLHHSASGVPEASAHNRADRPARTSMFSSALRWMRDAAIGVAIITSIPLVAIGVSGDVIIRDLSNINQKIEQVDRLRTLKLPASNSVSSLEAGQLMHSTLGVTSSDMFPTHAAEPAGERSWITEKLADDMFKELPRSRESLIMSSAILQYAVGDISQAELEHLQAVAISPVWEQIDRIASAPAVDILGAQYVLPFRDDASPMLMQIPRFADTKEVAYAGLARAAYHVAIGESDGAEHALRSVLSYGFAMIDNGSSAVDGLIGRVIVGIAADGLHTLYAMTGDETGSALTEPFISATADAGGANLPGEAQLVEMAKNRDASRTVRLESLRMLSLQSCFSVRGVLFGPSSESQSAFDDARASLVRHPSDLAYINLLEDSVNRPVSLSQHAPIARRFVEGASVVASTVLNNPRIQTCTRVVSAHQ